MSYPIPSPVTNLTSQWVAPSDNTSESAGINLSWTAPTIESGNGTIGGYSVYVLMQSDVTYRIDYILFDNITPSLVKIPFTNGYELADPFTKAFFPFSWKAPVEYDYPIFSSDLEITSGGEDLEYQKIADSYSFHVVVYLEEDDTVQSVPVGTTIFMPNHGVVGSPLPYHLNPRFKIKSYTPYNAIGAWSEPGDVALFLQDSYEEVASSLEMLLNTPKNRRTVVPDYGIDDPTFTTNTDVNGIRSAVSRWEPRANVEISTNMSTPTDNGNDQTQINVKILSIEKTKI